MATYDPVFSADLNNVRFSAYRTAMKLRRLQKALCRKSRLQPSVYPSYPDTYLLIHPPVHPSIGWFVHPTIHASIYLPVHPCMHSSVHPSLLPTLTLHPLCSSLHTCPPPSCPPPSLPPAFSHCLVTLLPPSSPR